MPGEGFNPSVINRRLRKVRQPFTESSLRETRGAACGRVYGPAAAGSARAALLGSDREMRADRAGLMHHPRARPRRSRPRRVTSHRRVTRAPLAPSGLPLPRGNAPNRDPRPLDDPENDDSRDSRSSTSDMSPWPPEASPGASCGAGKSRPASGACWGRFSQSPPSAARDRDSVTPEQRRRSTLARA